jgi:hypothetical protein
MNAPISLLEKRPSQRYISIVDLHHLHVIGMEHKVAFWYTFLPVIASLRFIDRSFVPHLGVTWICTLSYRLVMSK